MPALTMRGRYLMREYWSDSDLFLRLDAREREVYMGLWMLADDEGWLPRDIPAISASIYHYEDRAFREGFVRKTLTRLRDLGKVGSFRCCIYLPAVSKYPRAGKKSGEHASEHRKHGESGPKFKSIQTDLNTVFKPIQTDLNASPVPSLRNPSPPVVAGERAQEARSPRGGPMSSAAAVAGGYVARLAAQKDDQS